MINQHRTVFSDTIDYKKNRGWMISHSSICELNFEEKKAKIVKKIDFQGDQLYFPYYSVICVGDKFYLSPGIEGNNFGVYDSIDDSLKKIKLKDVSPQCKMEQKKRLRFNAGTQLGNYIVYAGISYPAVVFWDITCDDIIYVNDWVDKIDAIMNNNVETNNYFAGKCVQCEEHIFIGFSFMPKILCVNMKTFTSNIIDINAEGLNGTGGVTYYDNSRLLIVGRGKNGNRCLLWNYKKLCVEKELYISEYNSDVLYSMLPIVTFQDRYFVFPMVTLYANSAYELDADSFDVSLSEILSDGIAPYDANETEFMQHVLVVFPYEDGIRYLSGKDLLWREWNIKANVHKVYSIELSEDEKDLLDGWADFSLKKMREDMTIPERLVPLQGLIQLVVSDKI